MRTKGWIILGGSVAVGVGLYYLITRSNRLKNTGPSYVAKVPTGGSGATPMPASSGNQAYTNQANVVLRQSPLTDNAFLGLFGGNNAAQPPSLPAGTWVGTIINTVADQNGDINPSTSAVYNWYQLTVAPTITSVIIVAPSSAYYVREDFVNIR